MGDPGMALPRRLLWICSTIYIEAIAVFFPVHGIVI